MLHGKSYYKTGQFYQAQESWAPTSSLAGKATLPTYHPPMKKDTKGGETKEVSMRVRYKMLASAEPSSPDVWGPAFWFSLHNGAAQYPHKASPLWAQRMKHFIRGIPVMVPCTKCADHATAYVESRSDDLDEIVSSRDKLFIFFVDFHNFVNKRLGKPLISYREAYKLYTGKADVITLNFGPVG